MVDNKDKTTLQVVGSGVHFPMTSAINKPKDRTFEDFKKNCPALIFKEQGINTCTVLTMGQNYVINCVKEGKDCPLWYTLMFKEGII